MAEERKKRERQHTIRRYLSTPVLYLPKFFFFIWINQEFRQRKIPINQSWSKQWTERKLDHGNSCIYKTSERNCTASKLHWYCTQKVKRCLVPGKKSTIIFAFIRRHYTSFRGRYCWLVGKKTSRGLLKLSQLLLLVTYCGLGILSGVGDEWLLLQSRCNNDNDKKRERERRQRKWKENEEDEEVIATVVLLIHYSFDFLDTVKSFRKLHCFTSSNTQAKIFFKCRIVLQTRVQNRALFIYSFIHLFIFTYKHSTPGNLRGQVPL